MISVWSNMEFNSVIRTVVNMYILRGVQQIHEIAYISISHRICKKTVIHLIIKSLFFYAANYVECN
jgi:hypothetical protein